MTHVHSKYDMNQVRVGRRKTYTIWYQGKKLRRVKGYSQLLQILKSMAAEK